MPSGLKAPGPLSRALDRLTVQLLKSRATGPRLYLSNKNDRASEKIPEGSCRFSS